MVVLIGLTDKEIFNDFSKEGNIIPREYQLNPVDYRVDIYSKYSDELYDKFIKEGKEIHKKFNDEKYCNSRNKKLILHDKDNCYNIPDDIYAHGGYICGKDNKWDKTKCITYYCDIGYYYDQLQGKCIEECESDFKAFYIHDNISSKKYTVKKDEQYIFYIINSENNYMIKSEEDNIYVNLYKSPRISISKGFNNVLINPQKNAKNDFQIEINSFKSDIEFIQIKGQSIIVEDLLNMDNKLMFIIELSKENIIHLYGRGNISKDKIKYAKYINEMNYENIIKGDNKYFISYSNKIIHLEKDEVYFLYIDCNVNEKNFYSILYATRRTDK